MSDDPSNRIEWRAVPAALVVGLVLAVAVELAHIVIRLVSDGFSPGAAVAGIANDVALMPLLAIGAFRLARGLSSTPAAGARVFGAACFGMLGLSVFWLGSMVVSAGPGHFPEFLWTLGSWGWPCVGITMAIGIAMLAGARVHVLVIVAAVVLAVIGFPPPLIVEKLAGTFGYDKVMLVETVARAGFFTVALVIAIASRPVCRSGFAVVSGHGLRYIGRSLWLRIIAAATITCLTIMIAGDGSGAIGLFKILVVIVAMVNLVAHVLFAVGALQATHEDVPQYASSIAGACALWVAGVGLVQAMFMMQGFRRDSSDRASDYTDALSHLTPIIATLAVVAIIAAITGIARRRGLEALRQAASARGIAYVAISLAVLAIQFAVSGRTFHDGRLLLSLGTSVGGVVAMAVVAGLCGMAAAELERGPQLPAARLREP